MCVYLNGQLVAFHGIMPTNLIDEPSRGGRRFTHIVELNNFDDNYEHRMGSISSDQDIIMNGSGKREPVRFNGRDHEKNCHSGHRTNGKGGWIARNYGRKPQYKDRRLRASGSGKTRATNAIW